MTHICIIFTYILYIITLNNLYKEKKNYDKNENFVMIKIFDVMLCFIYNMNKKEISALFLILIFFFLTKCLFTKYFK